MKYLCKIACLGIWFTYLSCASKTEVIDDDSYTKKEISKTVNVSGADILFKEVKSRLTDKQKKEIFGLLEFELASDGQNFYEQGGEDFPFSVSIFPTDLNQDGKEEVFVLYGNMYTSGATGQSFVVIQPDEKGKYDATLWFPGLLPDVLESTVKQAHPDLLLTGRFFDRPLWQWRKDKYILFKIVKEQAIPKLKVRNVENYSREYQASIG